MKKVIPSFVFFAWCAVICAMEIVPIDPASACISIPSGRKNTVTVTCYGQNLVTFFIETCRGVFFRRQYDFVSGRLVRLVLPEDISSIRQISVDVEKRCLMIDGAQSLPPRQFTSDSDTVVTSDLDAIVETVSCPLLSIAAPNITMRGESFVPKLELRITGLSENRAAKIEGALSTEQMCVAGGKILNEGLIKFCNSNGNGNLNAETCEVENRGQICGDSDFVLRAHDVFNSGTIAGKQTEIRVDYLENTGEIGQENGLSKFNAYCIVNKGRLVAARGIFKISRSCFNDKDLN
ncbi:MAG: hypothetical protein LBO73_04750, partial [Holosporaceae bacterium]|nr:hypothetical protein [Holosporaceae bacterium]